MLGLGVDDMYILILSLNEQKGNSKQHFVAAMKEIYIPITMTSVINAGMFAIINVNVSSILPVVDKCLHPSTHIKRYRTFLQFI